MTLTTLQAMPCWLSALETTRLTSQSSRASCHQVKPVCTMLSEKTLLTRQVVHLPPLTWCGMLLDCSRPSCLAVYMLYSLKRASRSCSS